MSHANGKVPPPGFQAISTRIAYRPPPPNVVILLVDARPLDGVLGAVCVAEQEVLSSGAKRGDVAKTLPSDSTIGSSVG